MHFLVVVPVPHARRARDLVASLPVSQDAAPGPWRPNTGTGEKSYWRWLAVLHLIVLGFVLLLTLVNALRR